MYGTSFGSLRRVRSKACRIWASCPGLRGPEAAEEPRRENKRRERPPVAEEPLADGDAAAAGFEAEEFFAMMLPVYCAVASWRARTLLAS
ncbi:hypothetical protein GCM10009595_07740 [Falsarthrobacter nasiphocae]